MTSLSETSMLAGSSGVTSGYTIDQSIRFNDDDSPYLYKAYSGAGSKQTFTSSFWLKVGNITSARRGLISFVQDVPLELYSADNLRVFLFGAERLVTNRKLRDPHAWYHIVLRVDSTQAVSEDRIRLYINGVLETDFSAESYPSQNANGNMWGSNLLQFGRTYGSSYYFDGYLAEIHYSDGYSYGPENFGEFKENTDIWIPKEFEGSYGTNGVYLKGEYSSAFGNDSSGNDNDFGNVSGLTASDQVLDSPTNNFNTLNPLYEYNAITLTEGNLEGEGSNSSYRRIVGTQAVTSGKWYYEGRIIKTTVNNPTFGWVLTNPEDWDNYAQPGTGAHEAAVMAAATGQTHVGKAYVNNTLSSSYTSTTAAGDIFGIAIDFDNLGFYIHKNGTYYNSGDPTSGSSKTGSLDASGLEANEYTPALGCQDSNSAAFLNFGQDGTFGGAITAGGNSDANGIGNFKYAVPSGYLALCSKNLGR